MKIKNSDFRSDWASSSFEVEKGAQDRTLGHTWSNGVEWDLNDYSWTNSVQSQMILSYHVKF